MVKVVKKIGEDHKVAIRQERKDGIEKLRSQEKAKQITEDDLRKGQTQLQEKVDKTTKEVDELCAKKEKEILEV